MRFVSRDNVLTRPKNKDSSLAKLECYLVQLDSLFSHRRSWVIFRGGPSIPSCQNSILSCQHFFLSGGAKFADSILPC